MALANEHWAITGAAGSIGSVLRASLAGEVGRLRLLDIAPITDTAANEEYHRVDLGDRPAMAEALVGVDGVVHLGGISSEGDLADITAVNILGTFHVFEGARLGGAKRVVFASSNHATGMYPSDEKIDPDAPVRPDTFYGVAKVAGEGVGRLYAEKFGLAVACLRIGSFLERPTEARNLATWASHRDTAAAFRAAMTAPELRFAIFYVVSANRDGYWDLSAGERLGFVPVDHAEEYEAHLGGAAFATQGGPFSEPEATIRFQRS